MSNKFSALSAIGTSKGEMEGTTNDIDHGENRQSNPIQSGLVNLSLVSSAVKSPNVQSFITRFGEQFIIPAIKIKKANGSPILHTLANAGGVVSWMARSPVAQNALGNLDHAIDQGIVSTEMLEEVIRHPEYLKELANLQGD
jgi:hypothetical protein